jgi:branched-chain amino acid transport system ATP-binding protein
MSFAVGQGEVVTLLGRNGAGKTTTLRAIMGIAPQRQGSVVFRGSELVGLASNRIARLGIAYCPEERGIFASLDVEENLLLPPVVMPGGMMVDEIYSIFPNFAGATPQPRHQAFRRRAANAGDRPDAAHRRDVAAAG